jgi:hypothetical protein
VYGNMLHEAGTGLQRIDTTEGWTGQAADAFRSVFHGQPAKWLEAGDCFHQASRALDSYSSTLEWAQQQAGVAIQEWNEGQAATQAARDQHAQAVAQAQQDAQAKNAAGIPTRFLHFMRRRVPRLAGLRGFLGLWLVGVRWGEIGWR